MRIAAWLLAALCVAPAAQAQGLIEWSAERRLSRSDFRGRVPVGAATSSESWLTVDASWECQNGQLIASVRATFDPARSWWRVAPGNIWEDRTRSVSRAQLDARRSIVQRDLQLLEHEQLHFDLTEVAVRRLRKRFEERRDACSEPGGTDDFQTVVAEIDRELQAEQQRYDRETGHGTNESVQARWIAQVRAQLR